MDFNIRKGLLGVYGSYLALVYFKSDFFLDFLINTSISTFFWIITVVLGHLVTQSFFKYAFPLLFNHYYDIGDIIDSPNTLYSFLRSFIISFFINCDKNGVLLRFFGYLQLCLLSRAFSCLHIGLSIRNDLNTNHRNAFLLSLELLLFFFFLWVMIRDIYHFYQNRDNIYIVYSLFGVELVVHSFFSVISHIFVVYGDQIYGNNSNSFHHLSKFITNLILSCILCIANTFCFGQFRFGIFIVFVSFVEVFFHIGMISEYTDSMASIKTNDSLVNENDISKNDICIVCRQANSITESRKLKCGHCFHEECIELWFESHSHCPLCKKPMTK